MDSTLPSTLEDKLKVTADDTAPAVTINVGGTEFITLKSTLTAGSKFFARLFSPEWNSTATHINGNLFIDADPKLFVHILAYLRRLTFPIFWTRKHGWDHALYAALRDEARYFGIDDLEKWIKDQEYRHIVVVIDSVEMKDMVWPGEKLDKHTPDMEITINTDGECFQQGTFRTKITKRSFHFRG